MSESGDGKNVIFSVIKGGLDEGGGADTPAPEPDGREFAEAWVTDTRLMGVVAMKIKWRVKDSGEVLHQFFYFDVLENGFERFEQIEGDTPETRKAEISYAGGLGGQKIYISRREAVHLFRQFYRFSKEHGLKPPQPADDYAFLLFERDDLSGKESEALFRKMCPARLSANEVVNYFMMQVANGDDGGIRYLSHGALSKDTVPAGDLYTLHKNDITVAPDDPSAGAPDGKNAASKPLSNGEPPYAAVKHAVCESLIETDFGYEIWKSAIDLEFGYVKSYRRTARMRISDTEAFLALSHSEFVMIYQFDNEEEELEEDSTPFLRNADKIDEEDGYSYMLFRPDNKHVDTTSYRLSDDIFGFYHVTSSGQLISSSDSAVDIGMMELDLVMSPVFSRMELIGNYEFNEPVMAEFLESGYDDFNEFMREITREDD